MVVCGVLVGKCGKKESLGRPRHTESVCPVTAVLPKLTKDAAQLHRLSSCPIRYIFCDPAVQPQMAGTQQTQFSLIWIHVYT
jgi:hypothetical protein